MTRREHLLTILAEECAEVAQRASKALRFGLWEVQPGQPLDNGERLRKEMSDLIGVWRMLCAENPNLGVTDALWDSEWEAKREKIEQFLAYSKECGTLQEGE